MTHTPLYALDFDGVICDSALETGMAGWKAALQIWDDMPPQQPPAISVQFQQARPILETGYEAILIMRLLFQGETVADILANFADQKPAVIASTKMTVSALKQLFSTTRDTWIENSLAEWLHLNPLFRGVAEKLTTLNQQGLWYILTTKQERFVTQILNANQIFIPEQHIYGLDSKINKHDALTTLVKRHPDTKIIFIEDRLPALLSVKAHPKLQALTLQLADWGYNTPQDRQEAKQAGITIISLDNFITN
ncbi:MAG: HAD family hydrolase [Methylococcaceae bacterium]|nr:HAD family hydrolase [Methylococcaceae bacterium]